MKHFLTAILLLLCTIGSIAQVSVVVKMPKNANVGETFVVELTVNKANLKSAARIKQELPSGFTASPIASENGDFSFENNTVKYIWHKLPDAPKFKISYNVTIEGRINGKIPIGKGDFSYIDGKKSEMFEIKPKTIIIAGTAQPAIAEKTTPTPPTTPEVKKEEEPVTPITQATKTQEPKATTPVVATTKATTPTTKPTTQPAVAKSGVSFRVQFKAATSKEDISALKSQLKITENVYEDLIDNKYKYSFGQYSSVENAQQKLNEYTQKSGSQGFIIAVENGKRITIAEAKEKLKNAPAYTAPIAKKVEEPVKPITQPIKTIEPKPTTPVATQPATAKSGVSFRVQFKAATSKEDISALKSQLKITENVYEDLIDNYYKYSFGQYSSVENAQQKLNEYTQKSGSQGFIIAVENGKRITIAEAKEKLKNAPAYTAPIVKKTEEPVKPTVQPIKTEEPKPVTQMTVTPKATPVATQPAKATSGVSFRVQFKAATSKEDVSALKSQLKITENVYEDLIDNYYKYSFGQYQTVEAAQQKLNEFKQRTGAQGFIIAVENGKRITIAEAKEKLKK